MPTKNTMQPYQMLIIFTHGFRRVTCCVCLSVHAYLACILNVKRLELSTPKSIEIKPMTGPWHALTLRSKGQISTGSECQQMYNDKNSCMCSNACAFWTGVHEWNKRSSTASLVCRCATEMINLVNIILLLLFFLTLVLHSQGVRH